VEAMASQQMEKEVKVSQLEALEETALQRAEMELGKVEQLEFLVVREQLQEQVLS
jgi:hypothetical protein